MNRSIDEIHLKTVDSTNTWAKMHRHTLNSDRITCITADEQTSGRGRLNNHWFSPANENIYATFFFCLPSKKSTLHALPNLLCLSCVKVLLQFNIEPIIKWPNDILVNEKKIAGILCEIITEKDRIDVALGIGINVNSPKEKLDELEKPATSLFAQTHLMHNRNQILNCLKEIFANDLALFLEEGFSPFYQIYGAFLREVGKEVLFEDKKAFCHRISEDGRLLLKLPCGEVIKTTSEHIKLM